MGGGREWGRFSALPRIFLAFSALSADTIRKKMIE
jgi:hypothetical protein